MPITRADLEALEKGPIERVDEPTYRATMSRADYVRFTRMWLDDQDAFTDDELEQVCRLCAKKGASRNMEIVKEAADLANLIASERGNTYADGSPALHREDPRHAEFEPDTDPNFGETEKPFTKERRGRRGR